MRLSVLLLFLSACASRPVATRPDASRAPRPPSTVVGPVAEAIARAAVGRWVAVEIVGDAEASHDLRRGTLEKVLLVEPDGRVVLRGTDRARGAAGAVSFSGRIQGRVVTFAGLPGAALLSLRGPRLVLSDPAGRSTQFVRAAE